MKQKSPPFAEESTSSALEPWDEPCRPLVSLAFVAPILVVYEVGILIVGHEQVRNGADVWLRLILDWLGFGQYFLLPVLTCSILLAWHHTTRQSWSISTGVLSRMFVETSVFALLLLFMAQAHSQLLAATQRPVEGATLASTTQQHTAAGMIGYLGAGLYEELLFRLMLLPALAAGFRILGGHSAISLFLALLFSSLLFAGAHYRLDLSLGPWHLVTAHGDTFDGFSFAFRGLAGGLFGVLFVYRGFGIAVGTHALYDVLAVIF
jgi:hypothetical protein